jgi:hypothetical protein
MRHLADRSSAGVFLVRWRVLVYLILMLLAVGLVVLQKAVASDAGSPTARPSQETP